MTEIYKIEALRTELDRLLRKQGETLKAREAGSASETEILEYDLRQDVIGDIQTRLARSKAA